MLYISHFSEDKAFQKLIDKYGVGIESVDFAVGDHLDEYQKHLEEYPTRLKYNHLSLHGPFLDLNPASYDSLIAQATWDRFQLTYDIAQKLRADRIVFHSCFLPNVYFIEGWAEKMADFWNRFLDDKDDSIKIHMENVLEIEYLPICDVVDLVDHPAFSICLDVGHAHCYSKHNVVDWIEALGSNIGHVHIHDNDSSWDHHQPLGQGTIEWKKVFNILKKHGVDSFTIEHPKAKLYKESMTFLERNYPYIMPGPCR